MHLLKCLWYFHWSYWKLSNQNYDNKKTIDAHFRDTIEISDNNVIQTHNHLIHKRTLDYLAKLASLPKWLSVPLWTKS